MLTLDFSKNNNGIKFTTRALLFCSVLALPSLAFAQNDVQDDLAQQQSSAHMTSTQAPLTQEEVKDTPSGSLLGRTYEWVLDKVNAHTAKNLAVKREQLNGIRAEEEDISQQQQSALLQHTNIEKALDQWYEVLDQYDQKISAFKRSQARQEKLAIDVTKEYEEQITALQTQRDAAMRSYSEKQVRLEEQIANLTRSRTEVDSQIKEFKKDLEAVDSSLGKLDQKAEDLTQKEREITKVIAKDEEIIAQTTLPTSDLVGESPSEMTGVNTASKENAEQPFVEIDL